MNISGMHQGHGCFELQLEAVVVRYYSEMRMKQTAELWHELALTVTHVHVITSL
jgi:hypothetical protein